MLILKRFLRGSGNHRCTGDKYGKFTNQTYLFQPKIVTCFTVSEMEANTASAYIRKQHAETTNMIHM